MTDGHVLLPVVCFCLTLWNLIDGAAPEPNGERRMGTAGQALNTLFLAGNLYAIVVYVSGR